jgi:type I site-specific restriction endonuclease
MMPPLNFPPFAFTLKEDKGKKLILDPARKKWVALTPEEWVRQHLIRYLSEILGYPVSHMAVEKSLTVNQLTKRADILIYNKQTVPAMLIECKAPEVKLTNDTFAQVSAYNIRYKVPWLLISNGFTHHAAYVNFVKKEIQYLTAIPAYNSLCDQPESQSSDTSSL